MFCLSKSHGTCSQFSRRDFLTTSACAALGFCAGSFLTSLSSLSASEGKDTKEKVAKRAGSTTTGLVLDDRYLRHTLGKGHPESPERLKAILQRLKISGLYKAAEIISPSVDPILYLRTVHPESHVNRIAVQAHDESICRLAVSGALPQWMRSAQVKCRMPFVPFGRRDITHQIEVSMDSAFTTTSPSPRATPKRNTDWPESSSWIGITITATALNGHSMTIQLFCSSPHTLCMHFLAPASQTRLAKAKGKASTSTCLCPAAPMTRRSLVLSRSGLFRRRTGFDLIWC